GFTALRVKSPRSYNQHSASRCTGGIDDPYPLPDPLDRHSCVRESLAIASTQAGLILRKKNADGAKKCGPLQQTEPSAAALPQTRVLSRSLHGQSASRALV